MTYDAPITKLLAFLRQEIGSTFKEYYDGDPDEIRFQIYRALWR